MDGAHRGGGRSVLLQPRLRVYSPVRRRGSVSASVCVCLRVCAGREPSDRAGGREIGREGRCQLRGGGRTEEDAQYTGTHRSARVTSAACSGGMRNAKQRECSCVCACMCVSCKKQKKYGKQPPSLPRLVNKYSNVNKQAQTRNKVTQLRSSRCRNWELNDFSGSSFTLKYLKPRGAASRGRCCCCCRRCNFCPFRQDEPPPSDFITQSRLTSAYRDDGIYWHRREQSRYCGPRGGGLQNEQAFILKRQD